MTPSGIPPPLILPARWVPQLDTYFGLETLFAEEDCGPLDIYFGLEALFAEEDCGPSIALLGLAASGVCQCEFPVHQNFFELRAETVEYEGCL
jgi:hypothetical protein